MSILGWPLWTWYLIIIISGSAVILTRWRKRRAQQAIRFITFIIAVITAYPSVTPEKVAGASPGAAVIGWPHSWVHIAAASIAVLCLCRIPRKGGWRSA
jgi:hypothetical protein